MDDQERLLVLLEARVSDFEKKMAAAERRGSQTFGKLRRDSASATAAMEADMARSSGRINQALAGVSSTIGTFAKGFAVGFITTGLATTISQFGELARQVAEVGNEAKRAGVSVEAFQEWKYVAEQNRISVDSLIDGLKELNLRADEFIVTGGGPAAEAFARLGYSAEELRAKLADPSALLLEIIGRLGEMDKAAQIRIADEIFGGSAGERFVELLDQGEAGIRQTIERAHELGVVMDEDLVRKADDLARMFSTVATTVGSNLKSAIISAAASLVDFLRLWRDFDQQTSRSLESQLNNTVRERAGLIEEQKALQSDEGLSDNAKNLGFGTGSAVNQERIADLQGQIDALTKTEDEIIGVLQSRTTIPEPKAPDGTAWTPPATPATPSSGVGGGDGGGGSRGGSGGGWKADELDREIEAIERRTEALAASTSAQAAINPLVHDFGYAAEFAASKQELLSAAQAAGVQVTPELRARIDELAASYAQASAAAGQLQASQAETVRRAEEFGNIRREAMGGFVQDLLDGKDAADALGNALGKVADRFLDMALDSLFSAGGGGTGSMVKTMIQTALGSVYHSGGVVGQGGTSRRVPASIFADAPRYHSGGVAGLRPNEVPAILERGETVIPNGAKAKTAPQETRVTVEVSLTDDLDARIEGTSARVAGQVVKAGLGQYSRKHLPDMARSAMRDPRSVG